jgi:tRNA-(ms[2]io[6]A)-hydroxylase
MNAVENTTLGLRLPTDPRWVDLAALSLEHILTDHAFCEQKAATQCISLIQRFPDKDELVAALAPIVTEEWGHFRAVYSELCKRGYHLGKQRGDEYVKRLRERLPSGRDHSLLHELLLCALIEARSCERFRLLSEGLEDLELRAFYKTFMIAEAGHYRLFLGLAKNYFPEGLVAEEWARWRAIEAEVLASFTPRGDRMH